MGTVRGVIGGSKITALADARSCPSSRYPHFSRAALKARLNACGIAYLFWGVELGGRPRCGGPADYEQMATDPLFIAGLDRVKELASHSRLVLMCSEHEPLTCHRCLLVGRRLAERGVDVEHILHDGTIEPRAVQFSILSRDLEEVVDVEPGAPSGIFDVFVLAGAKQIVGEGA